MELIWNGTPRPGQWHLLDYTYDGATARVYDDGVQKSSRDVALATIRVLPAALTAGEIARDFQADAARLGASRNDALLGAPPPPPPPQTAFDRSVVPIWTLRASRRTRRACPRASPT